MRLLTLLAQACAVLAGCLLTVITLMTCVSLIGRNTTGWSIVGAFELTGFAAGAAIGALAGSVWAVGGGVRQFTETELEAVRQVWDRNSDQVKFTLPACL